MPARSRTRAGSGGPGPEALQLALRAAKRLVRQIDDVRGVDFGLVYKDGKPTGRTGIRFHMNRKRRPGELSLGQRLPASIEGIEIDVLSAGYALHPGGPGAPPPTLEAGISVGSLKQRTTGTLGPLVEDAAGQRYLMSNWHVLCGGPEAQPDDEICQPGPMDQPGGAVVAHLARWLRLDQHFDAAIARVADGIPLAGEPSGTTIRLTGTKPPALGMRLRKCGTASGVTEAVVDGGGVGSYRLDYGQFGFPPQWMDGFRLVQLPGSTAPAISLPGDSGAVWFDPEDGKAVGLHFAGEDRLSPLDDYALAHPIERVFALLGVQLADLP